MIVAVRLLLTALLALPALGALWAQTPGTTGGEIAEECANYPNSSRPNTCRLYVSSMIEFVTSDDATENPKGRLCIGKDVPVAEIIALVNEWLAEHRELHSKSAYDATYGALAQKYGCK